MAISIPYQDRRILVAIKPSGVLSTNDPGGMPELIRDTLGDSNACVRTVHRLDRVVGGVMVFARSSVASSELSRQIREHVFQKQYWAVVHGTPTEQGSFRDLLFRDKAKRMTIVVQNPGKDIQEAALDYQVVETVDDLSLVEITLKTGRTHQIRAQFSHHGYPLVGDRKYGQAGEACNIALWSCRIGLQHPESGQWMDFVSQPPDIWPWTLFKPCSKNQEFLDVVHDSGEPNGTIVARSMAHRNGIQHRTAHVWILRKKHGTIQILLQKRSENKDSYPGCYDISSAGHIPAGVDYIPSALRELQEELGCEVDGGDLIDCGKRQFSFQDTFHGMRFYDRQISRVYALWLDREADSFVLQASEVSEVRWFDFEECVALVRNGQIPNCIYLEELEMVRRGIGI